MIAVEFTHDQITDMLDVMNEARRAADEAGNYVLANQRRMIVNKIARAEERCLRTHERIH